MSPFFRFILEVSKRISSASLFCNWIVILLVENWMDFIVPVWGWFVWVRMIRRRMPIREIMKVILWSFMLCIIIFFISLFRLVVYVNFCI